MQPIQSFTTKDIRHDFTVDGVAYHLPGVTGADFEDVAKLSDLEPEQMVMSFRDILANRAHPRRRSLLAFLRREKSARAAVRSLNPRQLTDLFNAWTGTGRSLGESSGSHDSSGTVEPS